MKIVLVRYLDQEDINTRLPDSLNRIRGALPPLGLAYVAAVLEKNGYEVKIIDAVALNLVASDVVSMLRKESPDIVGITAMISNVLGALEAARIAKEAGSITVMGGPLMSVYPKEALSYEYVDYGIIGEGEYTMLELVRALESRDPVRDIKGLVYKEGGNVHVNQACIVDDLDALPMPARHLLPIGKYSSIISAHPVTTMIASRGCPYQCGFCIKGPSDKKIRIRDPKRVVDEMEEVITRYKVKEIMFYDDTITMNRKFITSLCEEILTRNLRVRWECPARVDTVDPDILKLMESSGCRRLRFGVESGDPEILRLMNKGIDLDKVRDAFRWTKKAGMETFAYFIIGYIRETPETIKRTIALAKTLEADMVMFTLATPYPTTPLFRMAVEDGCVEENYWRDFVLSRRSDRLPYLVPDAERWIAKAYRSYYFDWRYIVRRLVAIRSWHDLKKHLLSAMGLLMFKMSKAEAQ